MIICMHAEQLVLEKVTFLIGGVGFLLGGASFVLDSKGSRFLEGEPACVSKASDFNLLVSLTQFGVIVALLLSTELPSKL